MIIISYNKRAMKKSKVLELLGVGILCVNSYSTVVVQKDDELSNGDIVREKYERLIEDSRISEEELEVQNDLNMKYNVVVEEMTAREYSNGSVDYKDYYAGAYIEDERLVVCVTDEEAVNNSDLDVEFRLVENSYNELADIQSEIGDLYEERYSMVLEGSVEYELLNSIIGVGINEVKNAVVVEVLDLDAEKEKAFNEVFGSYDCVELQNSVSKVIDCGTY